MAERLHRTGLACLCAAATALCLNWQLRVGGEGLSRRRVFLWDSWTWDDLRSGRLRKARGFGLVDPSRPWWRRHLSFAWLDERDLRAVLSLVNASYRLPAPLSAPRVTLRVGSRLQLSMDNLGISPRRRRAERAEFIRWKDVPRIEIRRTDVPRHDFLRLTFHLAAETIRLGEPTARDSRPKRWSGATSEVVREFLKSNAGECAVIERILLDEPNIEDLEHQLKMCQENLRYGRWLAVVASVIAAGFVAWSAWLRGGAVPFFAIFVFAGMGLLISPVFILQTRAVRASIVMIQKKLAPAP